MDKAGDEALLKMLKHIHDQSSKETAFPEGKMKGGLFGHFPIKVVVPGKPAAALTANAPPAAEGHLKPLPALDKPSAEALKMPAPPPTPDPPPVPTPDPIAPAAPAAVAQAEALANKPTPNKPMSNRQNGRPPAAAEGEAADKVMDAIHADQRNQTSARE